MHLQNRLEQSLVPPPQNPPLVGAWVGKQPLEQVEHPQPSSSLKNTYGQIVVADFAFEGVEKAHFQEYPSVVYVQIKLTRPFEYPELDLQIAEFACPHWKTHFQEARDHSTLNELDEVYIFDDRTAVAEFIQRHALRDLLLQAREPLINSFGENALKKLSLVEDDEGFKELFCLIAVSGDMHAGRRALKSFDECWWLQHSGRAAGKLNFDFDLI